MLREGHAWAYRRYMQDAKYCDIEQEARGKEARAMGAAGQRLGLSTRVALSQERRDPQPADPVPETRENCVAVLGKAGKGNYEPPR